MKARYGIIAEGAYNFEGFGYMLGMIQMKAMVAATDFREDGQRRCNGYTPH